MFDSRTIKACRAWLGLCDSGITLKDSTLEDAVDSFRKLVEVAEGYETLCNSQESLIKTLEEKVKYADAAVSGLTNSISHLYDAIDHKDKEIEEKDDIIDNLREDIAGMEDEIFRLRELNNNQAQIILNRKDR